MNQQIVLEELDLPMRTLNALKRAGYKTVGDLHAVTAKELMPLPQFGLNGLVELRDILKPYGVTIHDDDNPLKINAMTKLVKMNLKYPEASIGAGFDCSPKHVKEALAICAEHGLVEA